MIRFLAYTGLRWGEATGLRIRQLDLARRRARIEENAVLIGTTVVIGGPNPTSSDHCRSQRSSSRS
jgi:integrase